VKPVPVIVTGAKAADVAGEKEVMVGGGTVNLALLVAVPPGVVTAIFPLFAPGPTTATTWVSDTGVTLAALAPLKVTPVAPVRFVPVIVTLVPTPPAVGVKLETVGVAAAAVDALAPASTQPVKSAHAARESIRRSPTVLRQ
jgi:hypothetical protein